MSIFKVFREFAVKGNMVDLAVGIIIGGAFGTIVKSLLSDIIIPRSALRLAALISAITRSPSHKLPTARKP